MDFHRLRTAYINMLFAVGADAKTVQELGRHANASVTFNNYGRANAGRMARAAEAVGDLALGRKNVRKTSESED